MFPQNVIARDEKKRRWENSSTERPNKGWTAAAVRITDENIGSEDGKHTLEGSLCSNRQQSWSSSGKEEGAVLPFPGSEGRIAQAWVNVPGSMRVFAVYSLALGMLDTEKEALMMEALKKQRRTRHPWLICDANMKQKTSRQAFGFKTDTCFLGRQEKACQLTDPKGPSGELIERAYECDLFGRKIHKLEHFGWSVSRPTGTLVTLACVSFHFIFPVFWEECLRFFSF